MKKQKEYPEKSKYFPYDLFGFYIKGNVLEIGCAEGNNTLFLKKRYGITDKNMFCIELDFDRIKKASKKVNAYFVNADARFLPFKKEVFDSVYCSEVIEHLPSKKDHPLLVDDIRRVLKHHAYTIITTPNKPVYTLFRLLALKRNDPTHKSEICYFKFRKVIGRTFKNMNIIGIFGVFGGLMKFKIVRYTHKQLMKLPFICKALVAICQK